MARVTLPNGILAIHGRLGNLIFRSRRQPDGTYKVFVHEASQRKRIDPTSSKSRVNLEPMSSQLREIKEDNKV